jgi:hypothetical protein
MSGFGDSALVRRRSAGGPNRATIREQAQVLQRLQQNAALFDPMRQALAAIITGQKGSFTMAGLLSFAYSLIQDRGGPRLDRLARRKKPALICWFCENHPYLTRQRPAPPPAPPPTPPPAEEPESLFSRAHDLEWKSEETTGDFQWLFL